MKSTRGLSMSLRVWAYVISDRLYVLRRSIAPPWLFLAVAAACTSSLLLPRQAGCAAARWSSRLRVEHPAAGEAVRALLSMAPNATDAREAASAAGCASFRQCSAWHVRGERPAAPPPREAFSASAASPCTNFRVPSDHCVSAAPWDSLQAAAVRVVCLEPAIIDSVPTTPERSAPHTHCVSHRGAARFRLAPPWRTDGVSAGLYSG